MKGGVELEARDVSRAFGERIAVEHASVRIAPGTIHAIVGENGAGKSTLLKMLAGALEPSSGEVFVGGTRLDPATQAEAIRRGVGMVYQHFALVDAFTGLENLMLGVEPVGRFGVLREDEMRRRALDVAKKNALEVPIDVPVSRLGVGERQRLEILRVLVRGARALLLDEPTAVLTAAESEALYAMLRRVASDGTSVGVVTHHLEEVVRHADEVTVMRRGRVVHHGPTKGTTVDELVRVALGDVPAVDAPPAIAKEAGVALALEHVRAGDAAGRAIDDVSLVVRAGEVVGVAGIDGNGQDALVLAIAGLVRVASGKVLLGGSDASALDVRARRAHGLETIHGDRHRFGMLADATVHDDLVLGDDDVDDEDAVVERRLAASEAVPRDAALRAGALSGGNQQKLVVARVLDRAPRALVAAYPTRGIDAAASSLVRSRIASAAKSGAGVLLVSGDLAELRQLAHRLVVLAKGRVVAELPPDAPEAEIGRAMLASP